MNSKTRKLIFSAVVGALYAVLTMALSPISYGPVQMRISEALCILPFFLPFTSWGLFFGCMLANVISAAGILDVVFGSLASLVSCLFIAMAGKKSRGTLKNQIIACLMPAVWNGIIVGLVLCYAFTDTAPTLVSFLVYGGQVALGELAVMFVIGLPLMRWLPKQKFFSEQLTKYK